MNTSSERSAVSDALVLHGLWQPVSTLRALALALTQGWATQDDAARLAIAQSIERETARLRDVVEDLTTLGMLERGDYVPLLRPEPIADLLRDAAAGVGELDGRLRVFVAQQQGGQAVLTDRGRVLQVLKTFLRQAEKGSDEGTHVTLRAELRGEWAWFTVTHPGGSDLEPGAAFELGTPGTSRLGLHLARRLIEAQGGMVEAKDEAGTQALSFCLPVVAGASR